MLTPTRLIILGSGSSASTPKIDCALNRRNCPACNDAVLHGAKSKNHRLNPCALLQLRQQSSAHVVNVLIDCGKTFRESVFKVLMPRDIHTIDAVILSHHHADATLGLDDIREFTSGFPMPIFADEYTTKCMQNVFPYLFPASKAQVTTEDVIPQSDPQKGVAKTEATRWVASTNWQKMNVDGTSTTKITVERCNFLFEFVAFPVKHGGDCLCNAFIFALAANTTEQHQPASFIVYMSDVSTVDEAVEASLRTGMASLNRTGNEGTSIELLLIDMLMEKDYFAHLNVEQAIAAAIRLNAKKTIFIGMGHGIEYSAMQASFALRGLGERMELGFDGMEIDFGTKT